MQTDATTDHVDFNAVKSKQREMWGTANYAGIGSRILLVSELLCEAADVQGGEEVLDVACGNGNAALAAARRFANATGCDYQPRLLEEARRRAKAEGLDVTFEEGDAEELPFGDGSFDVVLSACGAMFAPNQEKTASELLRVCRPGGRVGMVNWTPTSWVAELGRTVARYSSPPAGVPSPVQWGDPDHVARLFGDDVEISAPQKSFSFRFPSAEEHADYFVSEYPPIATAMSRLDENDKTALRQDIVDLANSFDVSAGAGLVLPLDYLEVVVTKS